MASPSRKAASVSGGELGFDVSKARLVRQGPVRPARFSLRALRESAGKTQAQVAKASGLAQPDVSKLETATTLDDRQLSTIRRYLAALGDEVELVAVSRYGHRIGIAGVEPSKSLREVARDETAASGLLSGESWEWDPEQVARLAKRAIIRLAELRLTTRESDLVQETAAVHVAYEAIDALQEKVLAKKNIDRLYPLIAGDQDAQIGEMVHTVVEMMRVPTMASADSAALIAGGLERFDARYADLGKESFRDRVADLLRRTIKPGQRPKKGEHTIGTTVRELQNMVGIVGTASRKPKTQRESIDKQLRKRRRD